MYMYTFLSYTYPPPWIKRENKNKNTSLQHYNTIFFSLSLLPHYEHVYIIAGSDDFHFSLFVRQTICHHIVYSNNSISCSKTTSLCHTLWLNLNHTKIHFFRQQWKFLTHQGSSRVAAGTSKFSPFLPVV